jgi:hypothetical protein
MSAGQPDQSETDQSDRSEPDRSEPWRQGYDARRHGLRRNKNPHTGLDPAGLYSAQQWHAGWDEAYNEANNDRRDRRVVRSKLNSIHAELVEEIKEAGE